MNNVQCTKRPKSFGTNLGVRMNLKTLYQTPQALCKL